MSARLTCRVHPRYTAARAPRPSTKFPEGCPACWSVWRHRPGAAVESPATELITETQADAARQREASLVRQLAAARAEVSRADATIETLNAALGVMREVETLTAPISIPRRERASGLREGCAVIMASDWHAGETVNPAQVFGRNEYNPDVFKVRAARMAAGAEWLIDLNAKAFRVRDAVVWLGGDLMTGFIHEDLAVTNAVGPVEEILLWLDAAEAMIRQVARRVENVLVPCSYGNHGRMTHKPRVQSGAMLSYEVLGYKMLARRLNDLEHVRFQIPEGEHNYVDVFDWTIRFTHGDAVRYQGGVGGVTIPLKKAVFRWDTARRAHYTCVGHFHQYLDMGSITVNGSLIGYSPFALRIAAEYEEPAQAFFLIDSKRGKCMATPIWVAEMESPHHVSTKALSRNKAPHPHGAHQGSAPEGRKAGRSSK